MLNKISIKRIEMKTWTGKIIGGTLVALTLIIAIPEKSFAQFGMGNTLAPLTGNDYPITFTNDSKGGHHQVATIADRDKITTLRRQPGMLCTVMDDGTGKTKTYQLVCADTKAARDNNANWVVFGSTGGGSGTPSGNGMLYGTTDPVATNGNTGDFYVNISNNTLFGPKRADNTWPVLQLQGTPTGLAGGDLSGTFPNPVIAGKAVGTDKIADQAVGTGQIQPGAANQVLVTDGTGKSVVWIGKSDFLAVIDNETLSGSGTAISPFQVKDLGVITAKLADGAVTEAKLGADAVTTIKIKDLSVTEAKLAVDAVTASKIKDGSVTESKLATDAVSTIKIQDKAVTSAKLGEKVVQTIHVADQAIGTGQIQPGAADQVLVTDATGKSVVWIGKSDFLSVIDNETLSGSGTAISPFQVKDLGVITAKLADGAVTEAKLGADAVTTIKIKDLSVTEAKLAVDAVTASKIKDGSVTESKLATDAVSTIKIQDKAVTSAKLGEKVVQTINVADQAIGTGQIQPGAADQVLVTDATGKSVVWIGKSDFLAVIDNETLSGSGTVISPFQVKDLGVITAKLADGAVTEAKLGADAVTTIKIKDLSVTEAKLAVDAVTASKIKDGSVTESKLATDAVSTIKIQDKAVTSAKLGEKVVQTINIADQAIGTGQIQPGAADQVLVTDATGKSVVWIGKSDFLSVIDNETLSGSGTVISPFQVKDLGVITAKLADGAVTEAKLGADAVTTIKIKDLSVTEAKLAVDAVTASKIKDGSVTEVKLTTDAITAIKIKDGSVTESKLATDAVSTIKIQDKAVTSAKLGEKVVQTINIADQAIGTGQIQPGAADQVLVTDGTGKSVVWIGKSDFLSVIDNETLSGSGTAISPFQVKDLGVITAKLADGAVTEAKLATDAVTTDKLKDGAVVEGKIVDGAVTTVKIKDEAVTVDKIGAGAVTEAKLATDAVTAVKIKDGSITESKLANDAVTTLKIQDKAITNAKLGDKVVQASNIADKTITPFQMKAGGPNMVLITDALGESVMWVNKAEFAAVADLETIIGSGTITDAFRVKDLSIITQKIADLAVTEAKIANNAVTTAKLADSAVTVKQIKGGGKANQMLVTNAEGAVTWADATVAGGSGTFNGNRTITGGTYAGINPKTNDIGKWIEAVFYPSASPTASISSVPALGTKEITSAGSSDVSLSWKVTRVAGAEAIKDITVDGVSVFTTSPAENGSVEGTIKGIITNNQAKTFTVVATTTDGKTGSGSTSVTFQWKRYYGFINGGDDGVSFAPTNAQIIGLSGSEFGSSAAFSKSVTPSGSQKLVIAYPASWGGTKIIVGVNDSTGAFDRTVRSFTNASGGTTDYVIYVQKDNTGAGYTVAVQ